MLNGNIEALELEGELTPSIDLSGTINPIGPQGPKGDDGFSPSATVSKAGTVTTITITDKDGTTTAEVNDGTNPTEYVIELEKDTEPTDTLKSIAKDLLAGKSFTLIGTYRASKTDRYNYSKVFGLASYVQVNDYIRVEIPFNSTRKFNYSVDGSVYTILTHYYIQYRYYSSNDTISDYYKSSDDCAAFVGNTDYFPLSKKNTGVYTPTSDYHPATKKYVDDNVKTYTAGTNVSISNENVISATDTTYTAGTGIDITNNVISNTQTSAEWGNITGTLSDQTDLSTALSGKQDTLTAGSNITISSGTISATDTTYESKTAASGGTDVSLCTTGEKYTWNNKSDFSGSYNDLSNKPTIPDELADLSDDSTHRVVTDTEKNTWSGKQDALVSGTNIKTINNESILGSGNITVSGGSTYTAGKFLNIDNNNVIDENFTHNISTSSSTDIGKDSSHRLDLNSLKCGKTLIQNYNITLYQFYYKYTWNNVEKTSYIFIDDGIESSCTWGYAEIEMFHTIEEAESLPDFTLIGQIKFHTAYGGSGDPTGYANVTVYSLYRNYNASSSSAPVTLSRYAGILDNYYAKNKWEAKGNKVTSISSSSTDTQYPSAKCVYDIVGDIESLLSEV